MKILGLRASNILKLVAVEISPDSNIVKLTGANKQGKSSVLNAICMALGGSSMVPDQPIHEGAESGFVSLDLGDIIVTRKFTATGDTLVITNQDGAKFSSPQAMLDKLIGKLSFDPLKFIEDKKNQVNTLLSVVDFNIDYEKLKQLSGTIIQPEANPLTAIDKAITSVKQSRTEVNRDLTRSKKSVEAMGTPKAVERVFITELLAQKAELVKTNEANASDRKKFAALIAAQAESDTFIEYKVKTINNLTANYEQALKELKANFDKAVAEQEREKDAAIEIRKIRVDTIKTQEEAIAKLKDVSIVEIDARIAAADKTNEAATKYETYKKAFDTIDPIQTEYNELTANVKAIENYKSELLANTKFPIEGLGFADGTVTYNGLPLSQASSAEEWHVGIAMGMALNPEFKVIMLRDASLLDKKHMAILEELAKKHDFQVWMEIVDESGEVGIYLEEGQVVKVN